MTGEIVRLPVRERIPRPTPKPAKVDSAPFDLSALAAPLNTSGRIADEAMRQISEAYKLARIGGHDADYTREWLRLQLNAALTAGEYAFEHHQKGQINE